MGVFKWLRRERVSITSQQTINSADENAPRNSAETVDSPKNVGTIRTEEYKRDLAEFRARRSSGNKDTFQTPNNPPRKKSARHSLPISCTKCSSDVADVSFNYEKTSARKYQEGKARRNSELAAPNIQFLFSNQQVFMPGNIFTRTSYSEVKRSKRNSSGMSVRSQDFTLTQHQIDFDADDNGPESPPLYFKNNCLPFEVSDFMDASPIKDDSINELQNGRNNETKPCLDTNAAQLAADDTDSPAANGEDKLDEVMDELRNLEEWADEQLRLQSSDTSRTESSKCDVSQYGLPLVASSAIDITESSAKPWKQGHWGLIPVMVKKLNGVTLEQVRRRESVEVNILRKFRHPNIILLMGLYSDMAATVHLICESCVSTLHSALHVQGSILSAQTSVSYASDIASALVFLYMQGYLHTELSSAGVVVTHCGVAKLADLHSCVKYPREGLSSPKRLYDNEAQYVNMKDGRFASSECQPLLSARASEAAGRAAATLAHADCARSPAYRWQPPELFRPDDAGLVYPCSRSDVYSLSLLLWECCNAAVPWQSLSYEKLSELYLMWKTGIRLPQDGTYPGCLLELLQHGLRLDRDKRPDLFTMAERLLVVKSKLNEMEELLIPERLSHRKSEFSSVAWETNSLSDVDSRCSPRQQVSVHEAIVHRTTSEESASHHEKENNQSLDKSGSGLYKASVAESCISDGDSEGRVDVTYGQLPEKEFSSNCSTPVARKRVSVREIGTPGANLHKSDSTEYCSIFSPENRNLNSTNNITNETNSTANHSTAKLCRSFTPQSYRSLQIKVPSVQKLEGIKSVTKEPRKVGTYNFDIKNYSLPSTPIARSNKLRKNAWLSGEVPISSDEGIELRITEDGDNLEPLTAKSAPHITADFSVDDTNANIFKSEGHGKETELSTGSPRSVNSECDSYTGITKAATHEFSYETEPWVVERRRSSSCSHKWPGERAGGGRPRAPEEALTNVNVKPLVAIHERWISEANTSRGTSHSSPDGYRRPGPSIKPASHSVEPLQNSVPQLGKRHLRNNVTMSPSYSFSGRKGSQTEEYCKARDRIARSMSFTCKDPDPFEHTLWRNRSKHLSSLKKFSRTTSSVDGDEKENCPESNINNTSSLDDFVKQLIKKEFYQLLNQTSDDNCDDDELIQKGTNNVLNAMKSDNKNSTVNSERNGTDNSVKSFSRVKISGNNKPLIQITFNKSGENSLHVLDDCVNVKICDSNTSAKRDKVQHDRDEQNGSKDDLRLNSLRRCQAFNAIQEARSTEDLYIDDDLSTHMEENFGGNMKLIPLHGSLHEILCEKADECCLIKVKQESGCDKVYFMCENPDIDSKDAIDGAQRDHTKIRDKVVFKRSISLIEERYERVYPKEKKQPIKTITDKEKRELIADTKYPEKRLVKNRPTTDVLYSRVKRDNTKSQSAPSLASPNDETKTVKANRRNSEEVVNIENLMSYQNSSSDESLRDQHDVDDFEEMEKRIEADVASVNTSSNVCGFLEKISEENLSVVNDEIAEKEMVSYKFGDLPESNDSSSSRLQNRKFRSCEELSNE